MDLEWAVNGTGAPGIFDSSFTPEERYGEYNCTWAAFRAMIQLMGRISLSGKPDCKIFSIRNAKRT